MHKIKPSEIIVVLRYGNIAEARRMYQLCNVPYNKAHHMTKLILLENDPDLYTLADQAKLLQITTAICDEVAGMNLPMLKKCVNTASRQYGKVSKCVTTNAASMAAKKGDIDILQYLLDNDCPIDWNASIEAIKMDHLDVYQWLEENVPGRVHHSFGFRQKCPTFQIQQYLYERGYRPLAQDFRRAIKLKDYVYAKWLFEIRCPDAYEPILEPPSDQMVNILKTTLNSDDFKWLAQVIVDKRLPDLELTTETSLYDCFPELTQYLVDHNYSPQYLFEYVGKNAVWIIDTCFKKLTQHYLLMLDEHIAKDSDQQPTIVEPPTDGTEPQADGTEPEPKREPDLNEAVKNQYQKILIDFVTYTDPNSIQLATMYLHLIHLNESSLHPVIAYIEKNLSWKHIFLVELNQSDQSLALTDIVDRLWDKYKDKLDSLRDTDRFREWSELKTQDYGYDQIYAFIGAILDL